MFRAYMRSDEHPWGHYRYVPIIIHPQAIYESMRDAEHRMICINACWHVLVVTSCHIIMRCCLSKRENMFLAHMCVCVSAWWFTNCSARIHLHHIHKWGGCLCKNTKRKCTHRISVFNSTTCHSHISIETALRWRLTFACIVHRLIGEMTYLCTWRLQTTE